MTRLPQAAESSEKSERERGGSRIHGVMRRCNRNMKWHRCHRSHFGSRYHIVTCYSQSLFRSDLATKQLSSPSWQRNSPDLRSGSARAPMSDLPPGRLRPPSWQRKSSDVRSATGTAPIWPAAFGRHIRGFGIWHIFAISKIADLGKDA